MSVKVIHPCDAPIYDGRKWPVFCKIEYKDGKLSIMGVHGPLASGNAMGGCGQIDMEFDHLYKEDNDPRYSNPVKASSLRFAKGWRRSDWYKFLDYWKKWHLNDLHAECEHQEAIGITYAKDPNNICDVCGYKIGSAWTKREVPQEVIDFLFSLPDTDRIPAWV